MIGLKRGTVTLFEHDPEWDLVAEQTIVQLKNILGDTACDITWEALLSAPLKPNRSSTSLLAFDPLKI